MSQTLRPKGALVGFGKIAEAAHCRALEAAGMHIAAVVETSPQRREAARQCLPQARIYDDLATLLRQESPSFVDLCTPPHLHFEAAQQALRGGADVLCEKPLVLCPEHGEILRVLANEQGRVVTCVHNWTQAPIVRRAASLVALGRIGPLRRVEIITQRTKPAAAAQAGGNWRVDPAQAGGGILFDHGWHAMSMLLQLVGTRATHVTGNIARRRFTDLLVEDTAQTTVSFIDGTVGSFFGTWASTERRNEIRLIGSNGQIEVINDHLRVVGGNGPDSHEVFAESLAAGGYRPTWTSAIVEQFKNERSQPNRRGEGLDAALSCLRLIVGTYRSWLTGGGRIALDQSLPANTIQRALDVLTGRSAQVA